MVEVSIGELLLAFVAAMGIPSAIMGLIVWRFKGHIEAREEAQAEKAKAQQDLFLLIVQSTRASIALGEATAHAMQRGHTNGDMETSPAYATARTHLQTALRDTHGIDAQLDERREGVTM